MLGGLRGLSVGDSLPLKKLLPRGETVCGVSLANSEGSQLIEAALRLTQRDSDDYAFMQKARVSLNDAAALKLLLDTTLSETQAGQKKWCERTSAHPSLKLSVFPVSCMQDECDGCARNLSVRAAAPTIYRASQRRASRVAAARGLQIPGGAIACSSGRGDQHEAASSAHSEAPETIKRTVWTGATLKTTADAPGLLSTSRCDPRLRR